MGERLTLKQAAERAGLTRPALIHAIKHNTTNPLRAEWVETDIGGYWIIDTDELDRYLAARWGGREQRPRRPTAIPAAPKGTDT